MRIVGVRACGDLVRTCQKLWMKRSGKTGKKTVGLGILMVFHGIVLGSNGCYPLVNCYIAIERSTMFHEKIRSFDWAIFIHFQ